MFMIIDNGILYEKTYMNKLKVVGFVNGFETNQIVIPDTVKGIDVLEIAPKAFYNKRCLEQVHLPESIEIIGEEAFANCANLEHVELNLVLTFEEKTTLIIQDRAFSQCDNLRRFWGYDRTITVKNEAFFRCYKLNELDAKIQKIELCAFWGCKELKRIFIATSGIFKSNCLIGSYLEELVFFGDGIVSKDILDTIPNLKIHCVKGSNIEKYAYEGYYVEIFDKKQYDK